MLDPNGSIQLRFELNQLLSYNHRQKPLSQLIAEMHVAIFWMGHRQVLLRWIS